MGGGWQGQNSGLSTSGWLPLYAMGQQMGQLPQQSMGQAMPQQGAPQGAPPMGQMNSPPLGQQMGQPLGQRPPQQNMQGGIMSAFPQGGVPNYGGPPTLSNFLPQQGTQVMGNPTASYVGQSSNFPSIQPSQYD